LDLGVKFGIECMCAAAIGNITSDTASIGVGLVAEDFCAVYLILTVPTVVQ
jgi:Transmembrane protein 65